MRSPEKLVLHPSLLNAGGASDGNVERVPLAAVVFAEPNPMRTEPRLQRISADGAAAALATALEPAIKWGKYFGVDRSTYFTRGAELIDHIVTNTPCYQLEWTLGLRREPSMLLSLLEESERL